MIIWLEDLLCFSESDPNPEVHTFQFLFDLRSQLITSEVIYMDLYFSTEVLVILPEINNKLLIT